MSYPIHPAAEIFPMMAEKEFADFKKDIDAYGVKEWGTLYRGQVLDGRNRYKACQELGIEMTFCEIDDTEDFDPIAYVLSHNLHRRHLTTGQRADVAAKIATMRHGGDRKSEEIKTSKDVLISEAASQMKVSTASVDRARRVHNKGSDAVKKAVADGTLSVATAAALVDAVPDKEEQTAIVTTQTPKEVAKTTRKKTKTLPSVPKDMTKNNKSVDEFLMVWGNANSTGKRAIWLWLCDNYEGAT